MGGPEVVSLEEEAAAYFGTSFCLALNSWTSGLQCAIGALALEPGDEVITSPWTMAATATSILHWNAVPVFADIDPQTFNLDPDSVESRITDRTRAVLVPDIFGQSADTDALLTLCNKFGLSLISDSAQSPGAKRGSNYAGTLGLMGGYSLNYHKHITCGEGGLLVTNDEAIAHRVALLRNHGEVLMAKESSVLPRHGILGANYRMGEIEAAIARAQLPKLQTMTSSRARAAQRLNKWLAGLEGVKTPYVGEDNTHVYYVYPLVLVGDLPASRAQIVGALAAEGVPALMVGYQNVHRLPLFSEKLAYGESGFPYSAESALDPHCPVAEDLHEKAFLGLLLCAHEYSDEQCDLIGAAFRKVWANLAHLPHG